MKKLPQTKSAIAVSGFAFATLLLLAPSSKAADVTYSASAPTIDGADIANLTGTATDGGNVNSGADSATYIAGDQPAQGQTFITGANAGGYTLSSITLQQVTYDTFWDTSADNLSINLRLGTVAGAVFTQIGATQSFTSGAMFPGSAPEGFNGGLGTGQYVTFTLAAPVTLAANTTYGFDVGVTGNHSYWETNGTSTGVYGSGVAYSSGVGGVANPTAITGATGDHVFHLDIQATAIPEPSTYGIVAGGLVLVGAMGRRRRPQAVKA